MPAIPAAQRRQRASLIASDRPVTSARSASNRAPAWLTTPRPSTVTTTFGREQVRFTQQVPFSWAGWFLRQDPSSQVEGHFHVYGTLNLWHLLNARASGAGLEL